MRAASGLRHSRLRAYDQPRAPVGHAVAAGCECAMRQDARQAVFEYMEISYDRIRMRSTLGYQSRVQDDLLTKFVS